MQKKRVLYLRERHLNNKQKINTSMKKKDSLKHYLLIQKGVNTPI